MIKVYCSKATNCVEQIFPLELFADIWDEYTDDTFEYCYLVFYEGLETIDYNLKYNKETDQFEVNQYYVEAPTEILKSPEQIKIEKLELENQKLKRDLDMVQDVIDFILMSPTNL